MYAKSWTGRRLRISGSASGQHRKGRCATQQKQCFRAGNGRDFEAACFSSSTLTDFAAAGCNQLARTASCH